MTSPGLFTASATPSETLVYNSLVQSSKPQGVVQWAVCEWASDCEVWMEQTLLLIEGIWLCPPGRKAVPREPREINFLLTKTKGYRMTVCRIQSYRKELHSCPATKVSQLRSIYQILRRGRRAVTQHGIAKDSGLKESCPCVN